MEQRFKASAEPSGNWIIEDRQRQKIVATFYPVWPDHRGVMQCAMRCAEHFNQLEARKCNR